jgi:hypothetical protein
MAGSWSPGTPSSGSTSALPVAVTLHTGEELQLDRGGDLGTGNAGLLIFIDGRERPEYVQWPDIEQLEFNRPPAMYPPLGGR